MSLKIAEKGWFLIALLSLLGISVSIPGYYYRFVSLPVSQHYGTVINILFLASGITSFLAAATSFVMAVFLYSRKRGDRMALYVSFFLLGYAVIMAGPLEMMEYMYLGRTGPISERLQLLYTIPIYILLITFPTGATAPASIRWIVPASLLSVPFILYFDSAELSSMTTLRSQVLLSYLLLLFLIALAGQVYRYVKKSSQVQRQQTKLVVFGIGIWTAFLFSSAIPYYLFLKTPAAVQFGWQALGIIWWLGLFILPISLILAVVRSHLWDIDIIIRKTLVYSLLTIASSAIYFGSVVIFQRLFSLAGSQQSPAVIVISTLIIAALFNPLRRTIQGLINRRFYRQQYDAQQTLQAFSAVLKNEIDLEQMSVLLVDVVERTIQPESVTLWLRTRERLP